MSGSGDGLEQDKVPRKNRRRKGEVILQTSLVLTEHKDTTTINIKPSESIQVDKKAPKIKGNDSSSVKSGKGKAASSSIDDSRISDGMKQESLFIEKGNQLGGAEVRRKKKSQNNNTNYKTGRSLKVEGSPIAEATPPPAVSSSSYSNPNEILLDNLDLGTVAYTHSFLNPHSAPFQPKALPTARESDLAAPASCTLHGSTGKCDLCINRRRKNPRSDVRIPSVRAVYSNEEKGKSKLMIPCLICAKECKYFTIGTCQHTVCSTCAIRLRLKVLLLSSLFLILYSKMILITRFLCTTIWDHGMMIRAVQRQKLYSM